MNFFNKLALEVFFPLNDLLFNDNFSGQLNFLQKSQWFSKKKLLHLQNKKLKRLIEHSFENVKFYNDIFKERGLTPKDINNSSDLSKLPIITKSTIRNNMPSNILAKNISKTDMIKIGSSGSTGEPLQYFTTKKAYNFNNLCYLRAWHWMGYNLGDKYTKLSTNPLTSGSKKIQNLLFRCQYVSTNDLDNAKIKKLYKIWSRRRDCVIRGYPSILYVISKYFLDNNLRLPFPPLAINTTGEILFEYMRKSIEEAFQCNVFDSYSGEAGATVFQCEHKNYHLASEYAITEFLDKYDKPVTCGKARIISTDLWNYAVPFIRYDVEDEVTLDDHNCKCGRNLPIIKSIDGRNVDILKTPSGKIIIVHFFTGYFEWIEVVNQFQVIQEQLDSFNLLLDVNKDFSDEDYEKISTDIHEYLGSDTKLKVNLVDEIPLAKSGKRRFVIRDCKYKL